MTEQVTIVGAGPAGLATAACLKQRRINALIVEASDRVGSAWRGHYDRLHLHTHKGGLSLPCHPFPAAYPRYPSRDQVVAYLEEYARHFELAPSFGEPVRRIAPSGSGWTVTTNQREIASQHVVVATGHARVPNLTTWPGLEDFKGEVLHSRGYKNGAPWRGKQVLVVGMGNSGGEIAIDLHEHGAKPTLSVRNPVNVIPRQLFGLPILAVSAMLRPFPAKVADVLSKPLLAVSIGNIAKVGLRKKPYGPLEQIKREGRVPLIDVGTLALIREGHIRLAPGIERFTDTSVVFADGATQAFDAVVLATGYRPALEDFLSGTGAGLHQVGFHVSARGMLKDIGSEARQVARAIAAALAQLSIQHHPRRSSMPS